jgi:gp16 family phage-associated protein
MTQIVPVCTVADVRAEFKRRGISVSEWARVRGVSAQLTYQILAGRKAAVRGQSHEIAVLLGLKPGLLGNVNELRFAHAPSVTALANSQPEQS